MKEEMYVVVRTNKDNIEDFGLVYNNLSDVDVTQNFLYSDLYEAECTVKDLKNRYGEEENYRIAKLTFLD